MFSNMLSWVHVGNFGEYENHIGNNWCSCRNILRVWESYRKKLILDSANLICIRNVISVGIRKSACFTTVLEKQPKFLSVGKISFRVHLGITTVLEKQPKFWSVGKISFWGHVARNYHGVGKATKIWVLEKYHSKFM